MVLSAKQQFFLAVAEYHQAMVAVGKGAYGENVARLQVGNLTGFETFSFSTCILWLPQLTIFV